MPLDLKTFILYFLFVLIPLAGITLYLALLALERMREDQAKEARAAIEAMRAAPAPPPAARDETDKELDEIRESLKKDEHEAGLGDRVPRLQKEKLKKADTDELGRLVSGMIHED